MSVWEQHALATVGTLLLGGLGWIVTSFIARPLLDFAELRRKVHEEIIYTGNISRMDLQDDERRNKFDEAVEKLRRLGAQMQAIHVASTYTVRRILAWLGFNVGRAEFQRNRSGVETSAPRR